MVRYVIADMMMKGNLTETAQVSDSLDHPLDDVPGTVRSPRRGGGDLE